MKEARPKSFYKIIQGDCFKILPTIKNNSINLIITDPPYNINKAEWDRIPDYIEWCGRWILECQ